MRRHTNDLLCLAGSALGLLVVFSTCVQKERGKGKSTAAYYIIPLPREIGSFDIIKFQVTAGQVWWEVTRECSQLHLSGVSIICPTRRFETHN